MSRENSPAGNRSTETEDDEFRECEEAFAPKFRDAEGPPPAKSAREEEGSKEPKLLELKPARLLYTPPYAINKKKIKLQVKNVQQKQIAFRVRATSSTWRFFTVNPDKGVISRDQGGSIDFKLMNGFAQDELNMHPDAYTFQISSMLFPEKYKQFDEKVWSDVEEVLKMSSGLQTTIIPAELKDDGKGVKFVNEPNTDKKYIDQPERKLGLKPEPTVAFEKVVQLSQEKVVFDEAPCGKDQVKALAVKNIGDTKIAFKIQTNKKKYYDVKPAKGVLMSEETRHIEFLSKAALTTDELKTDPFKAYYAMTVLLNIDKNLQHVDTEMWKKFEQERPNDVVKGIIRLTHGRGRKK